MSKKTVKVTIANRVVMPDGDIRMLRPGNTLEPGSHEAKEMLAAGCAVEVTADASPANNNTGSGNEQKAATGNEIAASDAARALAEKHGIDLGTVEPTGAKGITKGDVQKAIKAAQ